MIPSFPLRLTFVATRSAPPGGENIVPAIQRGIAKTKEGVPVLLEFITSKETEVSRPGT